MRKWISWKLVQLATWIHNAEHHEHFEIRDDYDVCRYTVDFIGDEYGCTVKKVTGELPEGWEWHADIDGTSWH